MNKTEGEMTQTGELGASVASKKPASEGHTTKNRAGGSLTAG